MYCKSCGTVVDQSQTICQACGQPRGTGQAFCEICGTVRVAGTIFCQECGTKFIDVPSQTPETPSISTPAPVPSVPASQSNTSSSNPRQQYCRQCGIQVMPAQVVCTSCGTKIGQGTSFCPYCAAPVENPQQKACMKCGMSLKKPFDAGEYFGKFAENFLGIFKNDIKTLALDYGSYLLSALIFLVSLFPMGYVSVSLFGVQSSEHFNAWFWPFCGFLYLFTFLISIARFEPHISNIISKNNILDQYCIFVVPGLTLISTVLISISILSAAGAGFQASSVYASANCGFTFGGILVILLTLASVAAATLSYLKRIGKISF